MNQGSIAITSPATSRMPRPAFPRLGMCGSSCMVRPTPWPPSSVEMPYPPARPTAPMAAAMSPIFPPGTAAAMPARSAASVVAISCASLPVPSAGDPMVNDMAASATQPSSVAPASTLSRSPGWSRYLPGMPCRATSLTDVQMTAGYGTGA